MKKCHISCDCGDITHIIRFSYDAEGREYFIDCGMQKAPFWRRLKLCWQYLTDQESVLWTNNVTAHADNPQIAELREFLKSGDESHLERPIDLYREVEVAEMERISELWNNAAAKMYESLIPNDPQGLYVIQTSESTKFFNEVFLSKKQCES